MSKFLNILLSKVNLNEVGITGFYNKQYNLENYFDEPMTGFSEKSEEELEELSSYSEQDHRPDMDKDDLTTDDLYNGSKHILQNAKIDNKYEYEYT